MNRTLWIVVGIVSLVLLLSGLMPLDGGGLHAEGSAGLWTDSGSGAPWWERVAPYLGTNLGAVSGSLLGLAATLLVVLVVRVRRRRGPSKEHRRARGLARGGRSVAEIARRMELSQDAVRMLLQPDPARRTGPGRFGKLFRSARFSPPADDSGRGGQAGQAAGA